MHYFSEILYFSFVKWEACAFEIKLCTLRFSNWWQISLANSCRNCRADRFVKLSLTIHCLKLTISSSIWALVKISLICSANFSTPGHKSQLWNIHSLLFKSQTNSGKSCLLSKLPGIAVVNNITLWWISQLQTECTPEALWIVTHNFRLNWQNFERPIWNNVPVTTSFDYALYYH